MSYANEIVYAHGEGPTPPARMASNPKVPPAKKVSRAKLWDEEVEDNFRFQAAQYRDEVEFKAVNPNVEVRIQRNNTEITVLPGLPMAFRHDQKDPAQGWHLELFQQGARMLQESTLGEDVRVLKTAAEEERYFYQ